MLAVHLPQPWARLAERRIGYALGLRNRSPGGMKYNPGNNPGIHCHIQGDASLLPGFDFLINKWGCNPPNNMWSCKLSIDDLIEVNLRGTLKGVEDGEVKASAIYGGV